MADPMALPHAAARPTAASPRLLIRKIGFADLSDALARGWEDFSAHRTDVMVLCVLYPVLGLVLTRAAIGANVFALLFPLVAGFALLGPLAGTGLYEMSRQRERGLEVSWRTPFAVLHAPALGAIAVLGLGLAALFVLWLQAALALWNGLFGNTQTATIGDFVHLVLTTQNGWALIVLGNAVGALFAAVALAIGVVSFPLLIDQPPGRTTGEQLSLAMVTSLRAIALNPWPVLAWGVIVGVSLLVAALPLFLGLPVAFPVLGHATWHLYRKMVAHGG